MMFPFRARAAGRSIGRGNALCIAGSLTKEDPHMKWETPAAIDFRFGMEITMYVSNR